MIARQIEAAREESPGTGIPPVPGLIFYEPEGKSRMNCLISSRTRL